MINTAPPASNSVYWQNFTEILLYDMIIFLLKLILGSVAQWSRSRPSVKMDQVLC